MDGYPQLPQGFQCSAARCGIKNADAERNDLALFISDRPCTAAGVFTTNLVCGAPVKVSREKLPSTNVRGVIINSGNSNACTGDRGIEDAQAMCAAVAQELGCPEQSIVVCSTGVIGRFLPMDRILPVIPEAVRKLSSDSDMFLAAAQSMMTTDTVPKQSMREIILQGQQVRVSGVCKGAAMIAPNMATMLCCIMTDARLTRDMARVLLNRAVADSFNCISVDGHESTSDSVILLANGAVDVALDENSIRQLEDAIRAVAMDLAKAIIRDAEGAHHFVQIEVLGARTRDEAFRIAKTVADSALVKTAICGGDPNWGRIVSAVGYAGVDLKEEDISLSINGTLLYRNGAPANFNLEAITGNMRSERNIHIHIGLNHGTAMVTFWTSDLTKEYVELNADYTT